MPVKSAVKWVLVAFVLISSAKLTWDHVVASGTQGAGSAAVPASTTASADSALGTAQAVGPVSPSPPEASPARASGGRQEPEQQPGDEARQDERFIVYYFHTTYRCVTCRKIEQYAQEAVARAFMKELSSGRMEWKLVNVEPLENRHYIRDYQLFAKSVVVSRVVKGQEKGYKNLQKIWELVGNKNVFQKYVEDELRTFMKKG
jgi:hypothetical protein